MTRVLVLNGVNVGRLGSREPDIYGSTSHAELASRCVARGAELGLEVDVRQTDNEAELIGWLHQAADEQTPVVLNPGAWSHYSIALADAAAQRTADLIEVHLSNIAAREEFRHHSVITRHATGVIAGLGIHGYELALSQLAFALRGSSDHQPALETGPAAPGVLQNPRVQALGGGHDDTA